MKKYRLNNKRGMSFWAFLPTVFFLVAIFPSALFVANQKQIKFGKMIGETQIALLRTYERAEPIVFYVDESARNAMRETIYEFGQGDFSIDCNEYFGYSLISDDCIFDTEDLKKEFLRIFHVRFQDYIANNFEEDALDISKYKLEFIQNEDILEIIGITKQKIPIEIGYGETSQNDIESEPDNEITGAIVKIEENEESHKFGYYYVNPSFHESFNFNLNFFTESIDKANDLIDALETEAETKEITEEYVRGFVDDDSRFNDFTIGYCDTFTYEDNACFDEDKIGIYNGLTGKFDSCGVCPLPIFTLCADYINEDYCNMDPCNAGCIWNEGDCVKRTTVEGFNESIIRFCIASEYMVPVYNAKLDIIEEKPIVLKFAAQFND
ncbi:MAG: hypothetical protein KKF44_00160 [Nanoarchaeota archaeon]|nr:hypothetical protein [Nanoarchaeota archaeon]